jgi:hypothetical protein
MARDDPAPRALPDPTDKVALQAWAQQFLAGSLPGQGLGSLIPARSNVIHLPKPPLHPTLLTVKLTLDGAKPPIWRRLHLRGDLTLDRVHDYLQAAMGWSDSHLHRFEPGPAKQRWQAPYFLTELDIEEGDEGTPETEARLDQVLRGPGDRLFYTYDFGDDWGHTLVVEKVRPATDDDPPAWCIKAVRACPPEDVGGTWTWNDLVEALKAVGGDPRRLTGEHEMYAAWLPPDVDPAEADIDGINLMLSLVGVDPEELLAQLRAEGVDIPSLHPAYEAMVEKAPPDLVLDLAALFALAFDPGLPPPSEAELADVLRPWQVLLEVAGADGIPLTKAGWMAPAACERLWHEGGLDWGYGKGNREQFTPELSFLRSEAVRARIVRSYRGRLVRTKLGDQAVRDRATLAGAIADGLLRTRETFEADERVITLLLVASGFEPDDQPDADLGPAVTPGAVAWRRREALLDEVARLLTRLGWRVEGGPVHRHGLREAHAVVRALTLGDSGAMRIEVLSSPAVRHLALLALTHSG